MRRPTLLSLPFMPARLKASLFARLYSPVSKKWLPLFQSAPLCFAPQVTMELVPGDFISGYIAMIGFYGLELTRRIVALAAKGGLMIDVGANLGYYSLLWAANNPTNRCVAFEASPRNAQFLRGNVKRNGFASRIIIHEMAAGKENGKVAFDLGPNDQTGFGGFAHAADADSILVNAARVDDVMDCDTFIDVLKVDVEGADCWVLQGCENLLRKARIGTIFFEELGPRQASLGVKQGEAVALLRDFGYQVIPLLPAHPDFTEWVATAPLTSAAE